MHEPESFKENATDNIRKTFDLKTDPQNLSEDLV